MKKLTTLFALLLISFAGLRAQTPDVQTIVDGYIEAIGGAEAWTSLKNMQATGKANFQGMEFPFVLVTAKGDKMRMDVDIQGSSMTQAYDGETAWMLFPMQGITEPTPMPAAQAAEVKEQTFLPEFINAEERGFTIEAVEGKEVEGTPTYGLRVTNEEGLDHTYYFDTEYMIPVMMASPVKDGPAKGTIAETYMSDYQEVEGIMMPMFIDTKINGVSGQKITLTEVKLNVEYDEAKFSMKK